jgi:RNA polymerase sigma-70 factor (ECF subfamily)
LSELEGVAIKLCRNPADARDLVQDTFVLALRYLSSGREVENERAWLFAILHNEFRRRCRNKTRHPAAVPLEDVDPAAPEPEAPPPKWTDLGRTQLDAAVEQLDEGFRTVYRMHALEGRSYEEISRALDLPTKTIGTRLFRARLKLKEILEGMLPEPA